MRTRFIYVLVLGLVFTHFAAADASGDLAKAIRAGDLKAVKAAVEAGAEINALDDKKMPPIGAAALLGKADIVDYLAEKGADVNKEDGFGYTPLMCAAQRGQPETAKALIKHGADPALKGKEGSTPMSLAAPRGPADQRYKEKAEVRKILAEAIAEKAHNAGKTTAVAGGGQNTGTFNELSYTAPDPKKFKSATVDGNMVYSTALPPPDFCTITIFQGKALSGDAEKAFKEDCDKSLRAKNMIKIEEDSGVKTDKQGSAEIFKRQVYCDSKDFHTCHLFVGVAAAGRFEFVAFESSGKETFDMYKDEAAKVLGSLSINAGK